MFEGGYCLLDRHTHTQKLCRCAAKTHTGGVSSQHEGVCAKQWPVDEKKNMVLFFCLFVLPKIQPVLLWWCVALNVRANPLIEYPLEFILWNVGHEPSYGICIWW